MIAALQNAAGRSQRSLLDVPLHAQMAAEAYEAQAAEALRTGGRLLPHSGISLYQLYRFFVDRKRNLYKEHFGLNDATFQNILFGDNFVEIHQECAMLLLVSDGAYNNVDWQTFRKNIEKNIQYYTKEKSGILWIEDKKPHFIHFTFSEYFSASWIYSQVNNTEGASQTAKELWRNLMVKNFHAGVKQMLEHMLAEGHPLHQALLEGNQQALEAALEASSDPNESDRFGRTALLLAASLGRADAVGALLAKGCDTGRRDLLLGWTALRYASACQQLQAAEGLLQAGADSSDFVADNMKATAFKAATLGFTKVMGVLIKKDLKSNVQNESNATLLNVAAKHGQTEIARILMEHGANINKKDYIGNTPIHYAIINRHQKLTKFLIEKKADPNSINKNKTTPLMLAAEKGDVLSARLLLQNGADPKTYNQYENTAFHYATDNGHAQITKLLLEHNADPNAENSMNQTPLMLASKNGDVLSARLLLQDGADLKKCDESNWTALHYATDNGHGKITKLLLEHKTEPNAENSDNETPLILASKKGDVLSARLLLQNGADSNTCDRRKWSALHYATDNGHDVITKLLLEHNADPNVEN